MKKLLLIFTLFASNVNGQTLEFTYDSAGNQIQRELVVLSVNSLNSTSSENTEEDNTTLPETNSINDNSSIIELYPNPVVDLINIEWENDVQITQIMLFDNTGKLLQLRKVHVGITRETFNLSSYSSGIYYFRLFDSSQQSKSYKIIKN